MSKSLALAPAILLLALIACGGGGGSSSSSENRRPPGKHDVYNHGSHTAGDATGSAIFNYLDSDRRIGRTAVVDRSNLGHRVVPYRPLH